MIKKITGNENKFDYFNSANNIGAQHTTNLDKYTIEDFFLTNSNFKTYKKIINQEHLTKKIQILYLYLEYQKETRLLRMVIVVIQKRKQQEEIKQNFKS